MHIKYYPVRGTDDKKAYIVRNVRGAKGAREVVETYPSVNALAAEHGDYKAFLAGRLAELESEGERAKEEALSITIDPNETMDARGETKLWRNTGYLFLQKAYHDLGIEPYLNSWKSASKARFAYSLNDAFRLMVFARVTDPCSKLATARKKDDYAEDFAVTEDDLYDCLGRADKFSRGLTRRLASRCRELLKAEGGGEAIYYDCTNFYFECQRADGERGLRDYGVEKNHRPDPIVEYGLLLDGGGFPVGSCCFRGNESEKTSLIPLLEQAGEESTRARVIVADAGLNTEANKDAIHGSGRNYIFCQSPKQMSKDNAERVANDEGSWLFYDGGKKKVKSLWITRSNGRKERMVVRWDKASADFANAVVDDRVERAKSFIKSPSKLSLKNCQDGKQYIKRIAYDPETGEVSREKSALLLDEGKIAEERKWAGYIVYVTDIPREEDLDRDFVKAEREGHRVVPEDDLGIVGIAGRRNDIEACFREMKSSMDARPIFVRTAEHIRGHLFTVYVALTLLMYIRKRYAPGVTPDQLIEAIQRTGLATLDERKRIYQSTYYSPVVEQLRRSTGLDLLNRKHMTWPMLKETIAKSKSR